MWKHLAWIIGLLMVIAGLWELAQAEPHLPGLVTGLLLVGISGIAGLRVGTDSAKALLQDTIRLNKVIMEQNRQLVDLNTRYMKSELSGASDFSRPQSKS